MRRRAPDFNNLRAALLHHGEPAYVPQFELGVDYDVKCAYLGRPVSTLRDEVDFWYEAGYDHVPLQGGFRTLFRPGATPAEDPEPAARSGPSLTHQSGTPYSLYTKEIRRMNWAEERSGCINSLDDFERFPWPDPEQFDLSAFEEIRQYLRPGMKVVAVMGYIFTGSWWLMGMENFCIAIREQPELMRRMYDRIWSIQSAVLMKILKFDTVGAVAHTDDLAYSDALLVSPRHYRKYIFPWYRWCGALVKDKGLPYIFHSDGRITSVLDDIAGCGFDALHPIEPKAMDIAEVKRKMGDRMCLIGNIDLGYTLTRGTPAEVDREVRDRIEAVGPGGGYCIGSANSITSYVPLENYHALLAAGLKYGNYPIAAAS